MLQLLTVSDRDHSFSLHIVLFGSKENYKMKTFLMLSLITFAFLIADFVASPTGDNYEDSKSTFSLRYEDAAENDDAKGIENLIAQNIPLISLWDKRKNPLPAAEKGQTDSAGVHVEHGADVKDKNNAEQTPLAAAIISG
ncbi:uncharacterized protein LOC129569478 [Sitodiplosis mosellana]|uniref:uncharacterized protein LOC129569478 n=1 Tax=Sitodiplosis mosellana TaxID=263140 RepID=UPI0024451713|nr:uncharacterized protein LOC129569478 [Sitodiplosis mosellana]